MYEKNEISDDPNWNKCFNLLLDDDYSEIEVNGPDEWFTKKNGKRIPIEGIIPPKDLAGLTEGIKKGLVPHVASPWPFVENSYLFEGPLRYETADQQIRGRCHIVLPPACDYPQITIAKKSTALPNLRSIASRGSMSTEMMTFLLAAVAGNLTMVLSGGTGAGKALTLDTPIPTPTGWKTMGSLVVGDEVFDHHGDVTSVTHKFPQPSRQVYEVTFDTGETVFCDAEHNWFVSTNKTPTPVYGEKTTAEMIDSGLVNSTTGKSKFFVPNLERAVEYEINVENGTGLTSEKLPMHPYDFGLKLLENVSGKNENILPIYEFADEESRKLLLAGLLDSKGSFNESTWTLTSDNEKAVYSAFRVANSLGHNAGVRKNDDNFWEMSFAVENDTREIMSIEPVEGRFEEMACITVDSKDSTYLAGYGHTTTHNTTMLEALMKQIPHTTRIGVAEDTPELYLTQPNVSYLHSVPWQPGMNPNDVATLSWVVQQYQRMRTDKLIIGETRGVEFADFLIAANSGMDGSMTTIHANNPTQCLDKMTNFATRATKGTVRTANIDIGGSIDLIIQLIILEDGRHRMDEISEITATLGKGEEAKITTESLYKYDRESDTFVKTGQMTDDLRKIFKERGVNIRPFLVSQTGARAGGHTDDEIAQEMMDESKPGIEITPQKTGGLPVGKPKRTL